MKYPQLIVIAFTLALLLPAVHAASMQYTFTGSGSGSLAGADFADSAFAIVGHADPANVTTCLAGCRSLEFAAASISIAGLGDFSFSSPLRVFNNLGNLGLSRGGIGGADLFSVFLVPADYDFASALGPVLGLVGLFQWQGELFGDVLTSGGVLVFNDRDADTEGSFRAQGVPLPGAVWLLASALLAGTVLGRRRG